MKNQRKFIGYIRVSTARQSVDSLSLTLQAAHIRDWAAMQRIELLAIHEDVGSARHDGNLVRRQGLADAIAHANREGAHLVVVRLDRLSRNTADIAPLIASLLGGVYALDEGKLLSSPRPGRTIMSAIEVAQMQADIVAETTGDALQSLRSQGRILGSGKDTTAAVEASVRVRKNNAEIAIERIADVLSEVSQDRSMTAREIADVLNERGIRTGAGRRWTVAALRRPLRDAKALIETRRDLESLPHDHLFHDVEGTPSATRAAPSSEAPDVHAKAALQVEDREEDQDNKRSLKKHPLYGMF